MLTMTSVVAALDGLDELVQFSTHCGVGVGTAPGNGTSPALVDWERGIDRPIAIREIANSLLMV